MSTQRRIPICLVLALVVALACAAPSLAHGPGVRAWLTTGDQVEPARRAAARRPWAPRIRRPRPSRSIRARSYQRIEGFGASITDSSAHLLARSPRPRRDHAHRSSTRAAASGSATCASRWAPRTSSPGRTTPTTTSPRARPTSPGALLDRPRRAEILPLLRQALRLNPNLKVMATPWSPPAWMKTNDSLVGGRFKDDPRVYDAYARYFVRFVQEYRRAGVPIDARHAAERAPEPQPERLSGHGPARRRGGAARRRGRPRASSAPASTRRSSATTTTGRCTPTTCGPPDDPANPEYAASLLSNPAARHYLAGTAFHCYSGDPERQSVLHDAFPQKDIYFTECSGSLSGDPATTFPDTLHWHTRFLTVGAVRNWAKTVITWNLALDPSGGPHNGGCGTCFGVVTIDPATGHATPTADYYVLGHVTRFIRPGAVRIDSTRRRQRLERRLPQPRRLRRPGRGQRRLGHDDAALQRRRRRAVVLVRAAGGRGGDLRAAARLLSAAAPLCVGDRVAFLSGRA